jgi:hypothetical protein
MNFQQTKVVSLTFFELQKKQNEVQNRKMTSITADSFPISTLLFSDKNQAFYGVKSVNLRVKLTTAFIWKLQNQTNMN